jgi:hypothetical protein
MAFIDDLNMVHRDLAARNVLIDSMMTGKVGFVLLRRDCFRESGNS